MDGRKDDISLRIVRLLRLSTAFSFEMGRDGKTLTSLGSGLAICSTPTTSFNTTSKAPSAVISGTTTNSTAFLETKGAICGWEDSSSIEELRRTEMRRRYPAFRASTRTAKPMKPVAPVICLLLKFVLLRKGGVGYKDEFSRHNLLFFFLLASFSIQLYLFNDNRSS